MAVVVLAAYAAGVATGSTVAPPPAGADQPGAVLDTAAGRIAADADHPVSRAALDAAAVRAMLALLHDPWSAYYAPADFSGYSALLEGRYTGVGLRLSRTADGRLLVASVEPGSPAAGSGVLAGDQLVEVGGRPVLQRSPAEVAVDLRGDVGTSLSLVVRRRAVEHRLLLRRTSFDRSDVTVQAMRGGVVRIRVATFTRGVGRHVRTALAAARHSHARGVVLDLRGDPGGLLDEAVQTAGAFLDGGPIVSYQRREGPPHRLDAPGHGDTTMPLTVLVDGGTASAAEVVAAALQDRHRAVVVGSRTFGKGSVQEPTRLRNGSAFELTVGRYLTPTGRSLEGVGLDPDIEVRRGSDPGVAERRAVEVLVGLLADAPAGDRD